MIEVEGTLDAHTCDALQRLMDAHFQRKQYRVVVKLEKVDYLSSAGAGAFVGALGTAREKGGDIVLVKPSRAARSVFDTLGLSAIFQIVSTEAEAFRAFS